MSYGHAARLRALKISVSAGAVAMALAAAGSAMAQEAQATTEDDAVEAVVVTGFRNSLAKALNVKREEAGAVDSILAEDIGKFPDLNLSESIQRIPGVALARDGGEGRQISVRGLGPQFTRVRINGMEALTTAGSADSSGGTNRGRSFDFNIFASDLFNSITVRKTAEATTEEGSLGATVDLRTARPFDYNGFAMSASTQASFNDLSEKATPRGAFMISNTWADGKFGALFSIAYTKRKIVEEGHSTVRWATGNAFSPGFDAVPNGAGLPTTANTTPTAVANNAALHPRFPRVDRFNSDQERLGATLALQFQPFEGTTISFDALYADLKGTREEAYLEAPSFSTGGACTAANVATSCGIADTNVVSSTIQDGVMVKGVFDDVDLAVENRFDKLRTKFTQFSLTGDHQINDNFTIHGFVGHSESDHTNPIQTTLRFDYFNVDGYGFDYTDSRNPKFNYGNAALTDPTKWRLTQIRLRPQTALNTYDAAQAWGVYKLNDAWSINAGLNFKQYDFETTEMRRTVGTTTNQETAIPTAIAGMSLANFSTLATLGGTQTIIPSIAKAVSALSLYDPTAYGGAFRLGAEPSLGNNRSVTEENRGGYAQADFRTEVGDWGLRGNFGVRYVKTKQYATGYTYVGGAPVAISAGREYDDTLPSMNLVLEPSENFLIRFGAAKVMSRPDLGSLTPGSTVSVSGTARSVTAGNPNLDPFRAKTFDLAFEWYFQSQALLSLALFQKNIDSLVQTVTTSTTFTGNPFGIPDSVAVAACGTTVGCSPSAQWNFSTPVNTDGGKVKGFEVNYQQPFKFLPSFLANTGVLLNYTYVKSDVKYVNSAGAVVASTDLTGLSRNGYNATLYYEDAKWSARVSASYRDRYLTRVLGQENTAAAPVLYDGTNETFNVDASVQYTLNDQFKITLEGVNLTDEYQDQFTGAQNMPVVYHHTGREILLGLRYKF
ncbi:TonB-dependent receptor [Caulobacter endophyticus]|uniref:TonB-dependent receptor n=1 Tax=Caulobacter endophyticus TaxID=2172652 RepID=A0A2T9JQD3_9CAUL|nr:TonB-dependent receptor [Caulobacter endophyticus]PVM85904.1 TonB-dependent receptor [Caulobacter endophyticus]